MTVDQAGTRALQVHSSYGAACAALTGIAYSTSPHGTITQCGENIDVLVPDTGLELGSDAERSAARDELGKVLDVALERAPLSISVGCWAPTSPGARWIAAAALGRGMQWGWEAGWMSSTPPFDDNVDDPPGIEIRTIKSVPDGGKDIPYVDPAWERTLAAEDTISFGAFDMNEAGSKTTDEAQQSTQSGGKFVGTITIHFDNDRAMLFNLGVAESHRRRGIGRALVDAALHTAADRGTREVLVNATDAGASTYSKLGFKNEGKGQTWWRVPGMENDNQRAENGATPLSDRELAEAVAEDDVDRLATLSLGALDRRLPCRMTPVQLGARMQSPKAVRFLVDHGAELDVLSAWELGWTDDAREAIERAKAAGKLDELNEDGSALLHVAVQKDDPELIGLLLAAGADQEVKDRTYGSTPARWADVLGSTQAKRALEGHAVSSDRAVPSQLASSNSRWGGGR